MPKQPQVKPPIHVERKTLATALGATVPAAGVGSAAGSNPVITGVDYLPPWAQAIIGFVVAWAIPTYLAYRATHTLRPDLVQSLEAELEAEAERFRKVTPDPYDQSS